jgi:hypothetical protein
MQLLYLFAQGIALVVCASRTGDCAHTGSDIGTYTFNKHIIKHRFCQTCGIHPYGEGTDPKGNKIAAINLRCIEGIDLESVPVQNFDGRSL